MRRRTVLAAVATGLLSLLPAAGCSGEPEPEPTGYLASGDFPVTVGGLTLARQPERIVSLSPSATELLFAIGAGPQVVAVDEFSDHPQEAPTTELSGFTPNLESIAGYDPDLVVLAFNPDDVAGQLARLEIPAYLARDDAATLDEVFVQITDLGALTGNAAGAAELARSMSQEIDELVARAPEREAPLTYYFELDAQRYAYTSRTWAADLLSRVGLRNIAGEAESFSVQLSAEAIIEADPDLIFLADTAYGENAQTVSQRDGWGTITAVRAGRVVELDSDVASRWGPRIVDLLAAVVDTVARVP